MGNQFFIDKDHAIFSWTNLGDIKLGRGSLGEEMPVLVYRLMQFTLLDVLTKDMGREEANSYLRKAGYLAGTEFAKNTLDLTADFDTFISNLQNILQDLKVGILRMEAFEQDTGEIIMTVGQDLDCSGLPVTHETVCDYDEGFIAGILDVFTGKKYRVREIDCWASGDRVCRFQGVIEKQL